MSFPVEKKIEMLEYFKHITEKFENTSSKNERLKYICDVLEYCIQNIVYILHPVLTNIRNSIIERISDTIDAIKSNSIFIFEKTDIVRFQSLSRELLVAFNDQSVDLSFFDNIIRGE